MKMTKKEALKLFKRYVKVGMKCWNKTLVFLANFKQNIAVRIEAYLHRSLDRETVQQTEGHRLFTQDILKKYEANPAGLILRVISWGLVIFVLWASFFHINETVKGIGQVVPSKRLQVIDNLEGGILTDILVKEGDGVKRGQIIAKLDSTQTAAKLKEYKEDEARLQLTIQRVKAQANNQPFISSEDLVQKLPDLVKQEVDLYNAAIAKYKDDTVIAEKELEAAKSALKEAQEKEKFLKEQLPLSEEQATITQKLTEKGLYSKLRYIEAKKALLELKSQMSSLNEQLPKFKAAIEQSQQKIKKVKSDYDTQTQRELKDTEFKLAETASNKAIMIDRMERQDIKSPIDGIVKETLVKTQGGVIQAGQDIMTIVPQDDELLIEAKIAPDDVGFVHKDMPVRIKVTTFDFTIYGQLDGVVENVSADALMDKQERPYFRVDIRAKKNYLEHYGKKLHINAGMQVNVDIETGRRTVMAFILKPILKTFDRSFTER
jgi:adhesin transport system membrane fusion protein